MEHTVELSGISKTFRTPAGPVVAVERVDLTIDPGEVVALLGPNGAGKTTTLDILLGLQPPTSGSVEVFGGTPAEAINDERISAVLQTGGLLRDLRVRETVELIASTYRHPLGVDEVMERAGITHAAKRAVSKCSGGEQQRLRFALALLPDPDLIILDEPTAGLDVTSRREFWRVMREDAAAGRTILFATHYLEEAEQFAGRVVMMADGRIAADGPTAEIRDTTHARRVSVTVPTGAVDDVLALMPEPNRIARDPINGATRLSFTAVHSDEAARLLLENGGTALEIGSPSLEEAFVAITGQAPTIDKES